MTNKILELLKNDEKISLGKIGEELGISFIEVLRNTPTPTVRKYSVDKKDDLFKILNKWDRVMMLVITPNFVLEIKDKFPKGVYGHGFLNFHDKESGIGGHLRADKITEIFLVSDNMFGRKSYSIKFFGEDEKEIFSVYLPRDEKREIIPECLEIFNKL